MRPVAETHSTRKEFLRPNGRALVLYMRQVVVARSRVDAHDFSEKLYRTEYIIRHRFNTIYIIIWVSHVGSVGKRAASPVAAAVVSSEKKKIINAIIKLSFTSLEQIFRFPIVLASMLCGSLSLSLSVVQSLP